MAEVQKITLVDLGQDFLEWYVREGIVIDCQPHQGQVWVGSRLEFPEGPLKVGGAIYLFPAGAPTGDKLKLLMLKYPIEALEVLSESAAKRVEVFGREWAAIKRIPASDLGL